MKPFGTKAIGKAKIKLLELGIRLKAKGPVAGKIGLVETRCSSQGDKGREDKPLQRL